MAHKYYNDVALPKLNSSSMHTRGVQMCSLGRVVELSDKLPHVQSLCIHEMVVRAYKHILQETVAAVDNIADLASSVVACFNMLLGNPFAENAGADMATDDKLKWKWVETFISKRFGWQWNSKNFQDFRKFTVFGGAIHQRPVQDLAFAVARFIKKGGTFVNYYMYLGGTNFGRTAGGPFVTTSYDYDAPIDEYGLIRQPKYGHLWDLYGALKLCESALVSSDPVATSLGSNQLDGGYAASLANFDAKNAARVLFNDKQFNMPPWSISILPDCKNVSLQ